MKKKRNFSQYIHEKYDYSMMIRRLRVRFIADKICHETKGKRIGKLKHT